MQPSQTDRGRRRRNVLLGLALFGAFAVIYAYVNRPVPAPAGWSESFAAAEQEARGQGKPLLIDFGAEWCPACRRMTAEVLSSPRLAGALADFVLVRVDVDEHPDLASRYGVTALPTFVVTDAGGRELHRFEGYRDVDRFLAEVQTARRRLTTG